MEFIQHLRIGSPLIWVTTDEPDRIVDLTVDNAANREVYRMDPFKGLVVYRGGEWLQVLVEVGSAAEGDLREVPCTAFEVAVFRVIEAKGVFIIENAHKMAEDLIGLFNGLYSKYRTGVFANDMREMSAQFVALSCNDEVPPELIKHFVVTNPGYPTEAELEALTNKVFGSQLDDILNADPVVEVPKLAKAGVGLTEQEFLQITLSDLNATGTISPVNLAKVKMDRIKAGGMLEIRRPKLTLDDIGGLDLAKDLISNVVWAWNNPEEAAELDIEPLRRLLFVGVPGTGKSAICEATAQSLDLDLAKFGVSQMMDKYIGESEKRMRAAFHQLRVMAPLVVWMDELGRDLSIGDYQGDGGTTSRVHGEFLTGIQELPKNVLLMAAANQIGHISPEMLRADRFDRIMFVGLPTYEERVAIFNIHLGADAPTFDVDVLAKQSETFTGAEIKALVRETRFRVSTGEKRKITTQDILNLIPNQHNRMWIKHQQVVIDMYMRARAEWDWASSEQMAQADQIIAGHAGGGGVKGKQVKTSF